MTYSVDLRDWVLEPAMNTRRSMASNQTARPLPGTVERLKMAIAVASRTPTAVGLIDRKVRAAGPDATPEDLEKLGLARCGPLTLVNVFRRAFHSNDMHQARAAQNALRKHPSGLRVSHPRDIPLMPWDTSPRSPSLSSRFLFVSGVARSGTTALGRLLGRHQDVAMYTELFLSAYGYVPEMLVAQNVRMLAEEGLIRPNENNAAVLDKSAQCGVVGDKRPGFLLSAQLTFSNFADYRLKVVHIVRNIYDVAASHQKWFQAERWKKDYRVAIKAANHSNRLALSLLAGPHRDRFVIVDYDRFWYSAKNLRALFGHAELDGVGIGEGAIKRFVQVARTRLTQDGYCLNQEQRSYIERHYDFKSERELKRATLPDLAQDAEDSLPPLRQ